MKRFMTLVAVLALALVVASCGGEKRVTELETLEQKASYAMGQDIGKSIQSMPEGSMDVDIVIQGIRDALGGEEPLLDPQETMQVMQEFGAQMQQAAEAERVAAADANLMEGQAYLEENKAKEGVIVTDSGLQYEVLKKGDGPKPSPDDNVTVHYKGMLTDETVFNSSYDMGEPASFPLNGVIPGWKEGIQLMPVGSTYRFVIPPDLAYGERGAGQMIGPNAVLIFEVELLSID
jgi:FKBP-type peptidyl-prolyl cis-trans isomerase